MTTVVVVEDDAPIRAGLVRSLSALGYAAHGSATGLEGLSLVVDSRPEMLTYSVVGNTNPALVTPAVNNERLTLNYTPGLTGSAVITVQATDTFGASVQTSFTVTVGP